MDDLYLLYQRKDRDWSRQLHQDLTERMHDWVTNNAPDIIPPHIHPVEGLEQLTTLKPLGPLSLVLLVLPKRKFKPQVGQQIGEFRRRPGGREQILPVSCEPGRDRPHEPLDALRSFPMHDLSDDSYKQLLTWLLIQMGLRVSSSARSVFISYRTADGRPVAERLEQGLRDRGYQVFRDDKKDDDGLPLLRIGGNVQEQIHDEIPKHSLLLVVDSPRVGESEWVREEITTALTAMRSILPVVIDNPGSALVLPGGRFAALRDMQREVRLSSLSLVAAHLPTQMDDHFFATLEEKIRETLLDRYRTSIQLVQATYKQFCDINFDWCDEAKERLLYRAEQPRPTRHVPDGKRCILVQCSPYRAVVKHSLVNTGRYMIEHQQLGCDYGFLVHSDDTVQPNLLELREGLSMKVLFCCPDEIPDMIKEVYG